METWRKGYDRRNCSLSVVDGDKIEKIFKKYGCSNINQFIKKIIHNNLSLLQISSYPERVQKTNGGYFPSLYQFKIMLTLSQQDGEIFNRIVANNGCENASQLARKIARGELILIKHDLLDSLLKKVNVKLEDEIANLDDEIDT